MNDNERDRSENRRGSPEAEPYVDAADRLERTLDAQRRTIRDIDSQAGFMIRVVAILLAVVALAALILATVSMTDDGGGVVFSRVAIVAAVVATVGLVEAMVAAIVTDLSSTPATELKYQTTNLLRYSESETDLETHLRRTLGVYADDMRANATIIQANAAQFRLALVLLLVGLTYQMLAATLVIAQIESFAVEIGLFSVVSIIVGSLVYYVLTERHNLEQFERVRIHE